MGYNPMRHQLMALPGPHNIAESLLPGASSSKSRDPSEVDPSALQRALAQAQANLLRYQELFDFAPDGYIVTDFQGIILQANHAAADMLGMRKEFVVGKPLLFYIANGDRRVFAHRLHDLAQEIGSRRQWELTLQPPRREPLSALVTAAGPTDEQASSLRWIFRDITRRQQAEEELRDEKDFADSLVELAEAAILLLGTNEQILHANPYFCELVGRGPGALVGKLLLELLISDDRQSFQQAFQRYYPGSQHAHGVHRLAGAHGSTRTLVWSARPLAGSSQEQPRTLLVGSDITDLQKAQDRAVQAERLAAIGQMVTGLAHESRNALQRSQACLSVLSLKLADRPAELELVARMQRAQDDLRLLYDDVREYAAPVQLNRRLCRLPKVWREAWEDLAPLRQAKQAELHEEIGGEEWKCLADPFRLKQVFRNLLDNALAACPPPARIIIRCATAEVESEPAIRIAICDNGPGFAPEQHAKAFEPFYTTKLQGTGLGLAICRRVVEAHGGRIEAGKGPGGEVILTLPWRRE